MGTLRKKTKEKQNRYISSFGTQSLKKKVGVAVVNSPLRITTKYSKHSFLWYAITISYLRPILRLFALPRTWRLLDSVLRVSQRRLTQRGCWPQTAWECTMMCKPRCKSHTVYTALQKPVYCMFKSTYRSINQFVLSFLRWYKPPFNVNLSIIFLLLSNLFLNYYWLAPSPFSMSGTCLTELL